jgi:hypothetical protein
VCRARRACRARSATVQATLANEKWLIEVVITAAAATQAAL